VKRIQNTCITFILVGFCASLSYSQVKLAQTGFNFMSLTSNARASGMGGAVNSLSGFAGAMASNPASMAEMPTLVNASFDMNRWIADINYISASVIVSPSSGDYGTLGLSVQSVDYGDLEATMYDRSNPNSYRDLGIMKPTALAVGLGYSKMISKQFGVGGRVKYAYQKLGENTFMTDQGDVTTKENKATAVAFDFGTLYQTGIRSIAFGMAVTNFSKEIKFESEGFQLPLLFTIGISANVFTLINRPETNQELLIAVDWTHPRSHPEQVKVGLEYKFMKLLSLRGGYVSGNDENRFTYGVGVSSYGFAVDYSYTPFGVFNNVQMFTASISL
jgi:hypothetical protein